MSTSSNSVCQIEELDFFGASHPRSSMEREARIRNFIPDTEKRYSFVNYGYEYFDGTEYGIGYGGYVYDGRYRTSVEKIIEHYNLRVDSKILEIGCAKGFILHEFRKNGMQVAGIDLSSYAVENAMPDIKQSIVNGSCEVLPWPDDFFDFVYSKETLPHLSEVQLKKTIAETMRVCRSNNIFFEIQVSENERGRELIKAWDETHQTVRDSVWWRSFFAELGFKGQVNYKQLF